MFFFASGETSLPPTPGDPNMSEPMTETSGNIEGGGVDAGPELFEDAITFDPAADFDAFLRRVPARWVVYLLADADDRPVQLLCVKNLRVSLKRRLGPDEPDAPRSKRVNYRELVRRVHYRRVDSAFEADWLYYEAARHIFPQTYGGMVGFRPAWFIHVDPASVFPRYVKTIDLSPTAGTFIGPVEDKHAAARLMQVAEDAFDLCRYYNVLLESPRGRACAYKEMGKCPAPCDGTISMDAYRRLVEMSLATLIDPRPLLAEQDARMRQAANELRFEAASRIKQHIDLLSQIGKGPFRHARPLADFRFLSLQHGPRLGEAKAFIISPGGIEYAAGLIGEPVSASSLLRLVFERGQLPMAQPLTKTHVERIGVVSHHLFLAKAQQGVFLPLMDVDDRSLLRAYRELMRQKRAADEADDEEGVVKELANLDTAAGR
jgi:hypothetical protein